MPSEEQLLNRIFDDGSGATERETAIAALKKITGKDRAGLVAKYARRRVSLRQTTDSIEALTLRMRISTLESVLEWRERDLRRAEDELRNAKDNVLRLEMENFRLKLEAAARPHQF